MPKLTPVITIMLFMHTSNNRGKNNFNLLPHRLKKLESNLEYAISIKFYNLLPKI